MRVLVLMATYNGEKFVEEQISSILNQENVSVKLIISDDKSSDLTTSIIERLINEGAPIELIKQEVGTGSAARNFMSLIKRVDHTAEYDFCAFSDQDDIWLPGKLFNAVSRLTEDQSDLYVSNLISWQEQTGRKDILKKSFKQKKYDFLFEGGSAGCTYVFNKAFFCDLKKMVEKLDYANWKNFSHDWLVYFFARLNRFKVFIDPQPFILYRIHDNNVHGHLNTLSFDSVKTRIRLVREGWYLESIEGFINLLTIGTKEYEIYKLYKKGGITRLFVLLRYNFDLMRSPLKFIQFALLSLLPKKSKKHV